jgi:hypothetical protein
LLASAESLNANRYPIVDQNTIHIWIVCMVRSTYLAQICHQEAMERAAEAAEQARKAKFDELELLREKQIHAREHKNKAAADMQAAQVIQRL